MRHAEGDEVKVCDCVVVASGHRDLPFIAKVTALFENPYNGKCPDTRSGID